MGSVGRQLCAPIVALSLVTATTGCRQCGSAGSAANPGGEPTVPASTDSVASPALTANGVPDVGKTLPAGDPGIIDLTFEIDAGHVTRWISPLIYGVNYDLRDSTLQRWGVVRSGGNRLTAYNWENNASNAGSDYLFQNDSLMGDSPAPAKVLLETIDGAAAISAPTIITISNADYVSADKNGGGDVRASGPDYLTTRFKRNYPKKPTPFTAMPDPNDAAVYQDELVFFLKSQRPRARLIFSMDNEPELWSHTHAEIFPKPVTYADLWKRNHDFAKAVKEVWPGAEVLGFVSFGYSGFTTLQNAADAEGRNFIEWYLDQAKAAESSLGKRLIDYLDLHWYPEAQGAGERIVGNGTGAEVVAAREQAPRSLWDATYEETSWIRDAAGGPINLLNWVQTKIDNHYPGTKLAFTEWNFGGGSHISGAVAVADVLGVFGRHGVALATYWPMSHEEPFAYAGFRLYRNYDGQGSQFGDTSIEAVSSDVKSGSVYASLDSHDVTRTTVVVINKATKSKRAGIKIAHSTVYGRAKVYVLSAAQPSIVAGPTLSAVATNAFNYEMPPQSISIVVPQL